MSTHRGSTSAESSRPAGEALIAAQGLGKRYRVYADPWHRAAEWMMLGRRRLHEEFWAIRGIDLDLRRGECVGVIGANGAGKSTLLRMVAGVLPPTEGAVRTAAGARVLGLFELGAGLNPMLSGRENARSVARLLDLSPGLPRRTLDGIRAFADIGPFFERPVRTYSTGMRARLAFSIFAALEPDVLLVDEALSVGDVFFRQKCARRLMEMRSRGLAMLFVTHDMGSVLRLCDSAIVLARGRVVFRGPTQEAISCYLASLRGVEEGEREAPRRHASARLPAADEEGAVRGDIIGPRAGARQGAGGLRIVAARACDRRGRDTLSFRCGEHLFLDLVVESRCDVAQPRAGLRLFDRFGAHVFGAGTHHLGREMPAMLAGERVLVRFRLRLNVAPGEYSLGLSASEPAPDDPRAAVHHDRIDGLGPVRVAPPRGGKRDFVGLARLPMRVVEVRPLAPRQESEAAP